MIRSARFAVLLALVSTACFAQSGSQWPGVDPRSPNAPDQKAAVPGQTRAPEKKLGVAFKIVPVADGFQNPWSLAFLPGGKMLVTERPGRLRVVAADGTKSEPVAGLPAVDARGQGGLLDVVPDPAFAKNNLIYWGYAEPRDGGVNNTAVARGTFVDGPAPRVDNVQVIFRQAPSLDSRLHFGCRLVWHRDGTLFITLGDRSITEGRMQAQRMDGLLGKVVRINADGTIPKDNPVRGEGQRAGGDVVVRSPQHPVGGAPSHDRRAVGGRARHPRRRRDQHRAQGQGQRHRHGEGRAEGHRLGRRRRHRAEVRHG